METKTGTYSFKLNGEFITKFLREIGVDDLMKAIDIGMNDIGMTYQQAFEVCVGFKKLCGTDTLFLQWDETDTINGVKLYKTGTENFDVNYVEQIQLQEKPFKI